jgi:hypothetical protein
MAQGQGSYSIPPPAPRKERLVISYLGELRRWLMRNNTIAGAGLASIQTDSGRVLSVKKVDPIQFEYWPITQASTDPLDINIGGGPVHLWDATNVRPTQVDVSKTSTPVSLTSSATNYVYLQATMTPVAYGSLYTIWVASAFTYFTATAEEANTADFEDSSTGGGEIFVKLGEVTTDGSGITDITPVQTTLVNLLWPWTTPDGVFTCAT